MPCLLLRHFETNGVCSNRRREKGVWAGFSRRLGFRIGGRFMAGRVLFQLPSALRRHRGKCGLVFRRWVSRRYPQCRAAFSFNRRSGNFRRRQYRAPLRIVQNSSPSSGRGMLMLLCRAKVNLVFPPLMCSSAFPCLCRCRTYERARVNSGRWRSELCVVYFGRATVQGLAGWG